MILLDKPKEMPPTIFAELVGDVKKVSARCFLTEADNLEERCTLSGIRMFPLVETGDIGQLMADYSPAHLRGELGSIPTQLKARRKQHNKQDKYIFFFDGVGYLTEMPANDAKINQLKKFKDYFYGNVFFMGQLMFLHGDFFDNPADSFVDMFLGKGGSLIAGIEHGATDIVGFEINHDHYTAAKAKFENYLVETDKEFETSGDKSSTQYMVQTDNGLATVNIYWANSITEGPAIASEHGVKDVISDIPWGCHKCPAYADVKIQSTAQMRKFKEQLTQALVDMDAQRITMAHHRLSTLGLQQEMRIPTSKIYHIAMYTPIN
jgi:hypothetical protein